MNSSTSSLHRRRLGEITEDAEEGVVGGGERPKSGLRHSILSEAESPSKDGKNKLVSMPKESLHLPKDNPISTPRSTSQIAQVLPIPTFDKSLPATPTETPRLIIDSETAGAEGKVVIEELDQLKPADPRRSFESRPSTHSTRPSASELDRANQYTGYTPLKPKVKRGPRPSVQRPRTAGSRGETRPVANLPNSVRVSNRPPSSASRPPSSSSYRPISQQSNRSTHSAFIARHDLTPLPPLPQPSVHISALYQSPNLYLINRPASPALSAATSFTPSITQSKPPSITPEKQRLMRALQLRKKQQMAKANQIGSPSPPVRSLETVQRPDDVSRDTKPSTGRTIEESNKADESRSAHTEILKSQSDASSKEIVVSISGADTAQKSASQSQARLDRIDPPQTDSSLNSRDAEVISSLGGSESPTSNVTEPSVKSKFIAQSRSPLLPPIADHSMPLMGVPSSEIAHDAESSQNSSFVVDRAKITEETDGRVETGGAAAEPLNPQSKSVTPIIANEEPPTQQKPTPPTTADEEPHISSLEPTPPVEGFRPQYTDDAKNIDPQSTHPQMCSRGMLELREGGLSPDASDISDDESLYDELQTAIFEEAKPVMVARSPFSAVFNTGGADRQRERNRSTSTPSHKTNESSQSTPEKAKGSAGRICISTLPQSPPTGELAQSLLTKKTNVSSGISKRIKALELFSGRSDATSPSSPPAPPSPPLTAGLVKKRMSSHSPNEALARDVSTTTPPAKRLQYPSPDPTPTPAPAAAQHSSSWLQKSESNAEVHAPMKKGNSISVTARIIRDPAEHKPIEPSDPSKPAAMNLQRSPLVVEHEKANPVVEFLASKMVESAPTQFAPSELESTLMENPRSERRRFSLSSSHSNPGKMAQSDSFTKRLSMTIRHGRTESGNLPRSASDSSSVAEEKVVKDSRKTRLMKRMSVLTAGPRRSIASAFGSNTLRQEEPASLVSQPPKSIAEHSGEVSPELSSIADSHAHVVDIGDVNIQFPDTLLWKRRFMRIDDQGYLILTPPTMETNKRGVSRRFHLGDFKRPTLPPIEREELPWSIVLDFDDGSCLQCACESRYAQGQVLRSRSSHKFRYLNDVDFFSSAHRCTCCISLVVHAAMSRMEIHRSSLVNLELLAQDFLSFYDIFTKSN
jgi:hypothetical protein